MGHLQQARKFHERFALDQDQMLLGDALYGLDGLSLRWGWRRRDSYLPSGGAIGYTVGMLGELPLHQGCGALVASQPRCGVCTSH
jgi:hypothetical protein